MLQIIIPYNIIKKNTSNTPKENSLVIVTRLFVLFQDDLLRSNDSFE